MVWNALLKTIGLCFVSIIIESISATKEGKNWFENLKQPRHHLSFQAWYIVGAVYYIMFGIIAYRQFIKGASLFSTPVILLTLVMIINGLSNFIVFKYRSLKWFYLIIYPFALLLLTFIIVLCSIDMVSTVLASIYFLWLIFDLYYGYNLWKLNDIKG